MTKFNFNEQEQLSVLYDGYKDILIDYLEDDENIDVNEVIESFDEKFNDLSKTIEFSSNEIRLLYLMQKWYIELLEGKRDDIRNELIYEELDEEIEEEKKFLERIGESFFIPKDVTINISDCGLHLLIWACDNCNLKAYNYKLFCGEPTDHFSLIKDELIAKLES